MANFFVPPGHPNILIVYGSGVYERNADGSYNDGANRSTLQSYIRTNPAGCPVTLDSHDFWITHPIGYLGSDFDPSTVIHDMDHDFKGVIRMGFDLSSLTAATATTYFWVLLQENGHYWLVPPELSFGGTRVTLAAQFQEAFMNGNAFPQLQLLGRDNIHWSSHIQANPSPLDGIDWQPIETIALEGTNADPNILRRYFPTPTSANTISIDGVGDGGYPDYPDLDKVIMGIIPKENAYANDGNGFYELIPQWAAPVNFQGGLTLVFGLADVVIFGFSKGFNTIGISRTGINYTESWDISSFYKPWEFASRIVFRVIRRNNDYYFQATQEIGTIGCLGTILQSLHLYTPPPVTNPYENWEQPGASVTNPVNLQSWTTLKIIQSNTPAMAVGYGNKSWFPDGWVDFNFKPLMIKDASTELTPIGTDPASFVNVTSADYTSSLNNNRFVFHKPTANPRIRGNSSSCNLTVNGDADNWTDIDQMPKLLVSPPAGDFVAAGSVRLDRCCLAPWAAGAYMNVNLWATRRKIQVSSIGLPEDTEYRRTNPARIYKAAFIFVAQNREDVTTAMIENLDKLRVAYETVFNTATGTARSVNTSL